MSTSSGSPAPASDPLAARAAQLARAHSAHGELELLFVRQIASAEATFLSLERALARLAHRPRLDARSEARLERLTRAQARAQRILTTALKELYALQARRAAAQLNPAAQPAVALAIAPAIAPAAAHLTSRLLADPAFLSQHARQLLPAKPVNKPARRSRPLTRTAA